MASITQVTSYVQIAAQTAADITSSKEKWTAFLRTAAKLYRYSFTDLLLIHAQNPNATACAEYDTYKKMRWFVKRGSKGIALVDVRNGRRPDLRYVFDIKDTGRNRNSYNLYLWQYKNEHQDTVTKALEERYDVSGEEGILVQVAHIAAKTARDYWKNYKKEIRCEVEGSLLEGLDDRDLSKRFCDMEAYSVAYAVLYRCSFNPDLYHLSPDTFSGITDFNTQGITKTLGYVVSQTSEEILHLIGIAVTDYERKKQNASRTASQNATHDDKRKDKKQPSSFVISLDSQKDSTSSVKSSLKEIFNKYKPIVKDFLIKYKKYKNACRNSDKENAVLEGIAAIKRAALGIKDLEFMKLFYDIAEFHDRMQQEVLDETYPELSATTEPKQNTSEPCQEDADPTESEQNASEQETFEEEPKQKATDEENPEPATEKTESKESVHAKPKPDTKSVPKPDYKVGDTVYLENTLYEITEIGLFDVQLRDPSQAYPIFRVESKERLKDMLQRDHRNVSKPEPDHHEEPQAHPVTVLDESEVEVLPPTHAASNYRITDNRLGEGGEKEKYSYNMYAIIMLKKIESENRAATLEEQEILAHYVGWGGIPNAVAAHLF